MERILLWGAGRNFENKIECIRKLKELNVEIVGVVDSNEELWGKSKYGFEIMQPKYFDKIDYIVVTSVDYYEEIRKNIFKIYRIIDEETVVLLLDYYRKKYAERQYELKYLNDEKTQKKDIIVYTSIIGNYDKLKDPKYEGNNIRYYCITDNHSLKSNIWKMKYVVKPKDYSDVKYARYIKLHPEEFIGECEINVWVDAKYRIIGNIEEYIEKYKRDKDIICFPHPERDCIYEEAEMCLFYERGIKEDIGRQIKFYKEKKYPKNNGLYETGCIVRKTNSKIVNDIMRDWWNEVYKFSERDQISFPVILQKYKYGPDICNIDINNNEWLISEKHLK